MSRVHVLYLAIGFPPAAKSSTYRLRATANELVRAGARVTVLNLDDESWRRESGVDESLLEGVDPAVRVVRLPLRRPELDPRVDRYGAFRTYLPVRWNRRMTRRSTAVFPEPTFGRWRDALIRAAEEIHRHDPLDLMLVTMVPYTGMAVATAMKERHGVPYALDYRDGWAIDVINGVEAFAPDSRSGRIEQAALAGAESVWFVNEAIADFYRRRHPDVAERIRVVRNGWDPFDVPAARPRRPGEGLVFGYLGTAVFPLQYTNALLEGWKLAREKDPRIGRSRLEFHGHFGFRSSGLANSHTRRIAAASSHGASFHGPVAKSDVGKLYASWDALVFLITGGPYMTSGKVYEYMATGKPIISVHDAAHGSAEVLEGYPLWIRPPAALEPELIARSFIAAADMAQSHDHDDRARALEHARQFARRNLLEQPVRDLLAAVTLRTSVRRTGTVMLVGTVRPEWPRLRSTVGELKDHGYDATLAGTFQAGPLASTGVRTVHPARPSWGTVGGRRPRRLTPAWAWLVLRNRVARRWASTPRRELLLAARLDPALRELAQQADAIVALDPASVPAARSLARRHGRPAFLGVPPFLDALPPARRALALWTRAVAGKAEVVGHDELVTAAAVVLEGRGTSSDDPALAREAAAVIERLRSAKRTQVARQVLGLARRSGHDHPLLDLAGCALDLDDGVRVDAAVITGLVARALEDADRALAEGAVNLATDLVLRSLRVTFHRELHAAVASTPLVESPSTFLAPYRVSRAVAALARPAGDHRPPRRAGRRVLVVTSGNLHFTRNVMEELRAAGADVRVLDLTSPDIAAEAHAWHWTQTRDRLLRGSGKPYQRLPDQLADRLAWADTVFVDWSDHAAVWAELHVPDDTRLVVRVHSIDALSVDPQLIDWSRVDDVVFVSDHIRALASRTFPGIDRAGAVHVVPNAVDLARFSETKSGLARRTLGLVGWGQAVKDPVWTLDLLARLRAHDRSWSLRLIGRDFSQFQTAGGYRYVEQFRARILEPDVRDAVVQVGYTEDLPRVLQDVGFIISSSLRESSHVAVAEGVASGALPVIRSWPTFATLDGARGVYPAEWVVEDLQEAEQRILAHADETTWQLATKAARQHILAWGDRSATRGAYRRVFGLEDD